MPPTSATASPRGDDARDDEEGHHDPGGEQRVRDVDRPDGRISDVVKHFAGNDDLRLRAFRNKEANCKKGADENNGDENLEELQIIPVPSLRR